MRLVCPTAFKGTFSPLEAARRLARPGDRILPVSDGGDGFLECLRHALGGALERHEAADPFGVLRPVPVLRLPDGTVALECAQVIGLAGLAELDPLRASSQGFGALIARFVDAPRLWIGLGGSATVDGGGDWPPLRLPPTAVFCDVATDLRQTAARFGPQKGARPEDVPRLTERLLGLGLPTGPFTGAAGGLGAKLKSLGAELQDGAMAFLALAGFDRACEGCDEVLTGEGRLDAGTLEGKLPIRVAQRAHALGLRVIGHFGAKGEGWEAAGSGFDELRFGLD
ncbi:MAG: glycerate kinase [Holophagaceae bacterium]|nr:glycerate kinase [Holophagaceae bacterium]